MAKKRGQIQFRYYEIPNGEPLLALLGERWIRHYGYDQNDERIKELHFHNLLEIGYCYEGSGHIVLEDKNYPYSGGTFTVIPRNYPHNTSGEGEKRDRWEYLFIDVEKTLQELYPDGKRYALQMEESLRRFAICTSGKNYPELMQIIHNILAEMASRRPMYEEKVRGLLRALFVEITRCDQSKEKGSGQVEPKQKPQQDHLTVVLEYIARNYMHPLRVGELAEFCHMSEPHFRKIFLRHMGMHPVEFLNQLRVKKACERLQKTNDSVSDVAVKCGFTSIATFNRNFKKYTGVTPGECRNQPDAFERRLQENNIFVYDGWM